MRATVASYEYKDRSHLTHPIGSHIFLYVIGGRRYQLTVLVSLVEENPIGIIFSLAAPEHTRSVDTALWVASDNTDGWTSTEPTLNLDSLGIDLSVWFVREWV